MNAQSDRLRTEQLLRSLLRSDALIQRQSIPGDWPAFIRGDHRKRPLFWVNSADVEVLLSDKVLANTPKGVGLSGATRRRLLYGASDREVETRTEFVPSGVQRPVRRNVRGSVLQRLSHRRGQDRERLLNDTQVTAAHRYTQALLKSGEGHVGTTDPSAPKVDGTRRHDAAERAALARIDANRSLQSARNALGSDLSRLLNAVCGADERLEAIERAENWSRGTGLAILRMALDRLTLHYGTIPGQSHPRSDRLTR